MKAIMVMFDSLNRHMLPPYGCDWSHAPNFRRLAKRTITFDRSYVCSMPCIPARRDLHTGRPNFLHRSWGPLEPFDDSLPELLRAQGVHSHLASDHYHYWEDGGATYHTRYSSWECFRGQEGDPCIGQVAPPVIPETLNGKKRDQDWVNRGHFRAEADQPLSRTFAAGLRHIERNHAQDNWFLQIECFDPHEPFFSPRKYKDLYPHDYNGPIFDWPDYGPTKETPEQIAHVRLEYAALLSMCDAHLGDVLDAMDRFEMWEDTMLIVWTDHGFLLSEHGCWAKKWMPLYEEVSHTPFFVWDPRSGAHGERRSSLVQPAIDLAPTLLDFFGTTATPDMTGKSLTPVIRADQPVRETAIFGFHGDRINVTDGRYVYYGSPVESNQPLYDYTLMPTQMRGFFPVDRLKRAELSKPFPFTKDIRPLRILAQGRVARTADGNTESLLFDLEADPGQENPIRNSMIEERMKALMAAAMRECAAPDEQFERMGFKEIS